MTVNIQGRKCRVLPRCGGVESEAPSGFGGGAGGGAEVGGRSAGAGVSGRGGGGVLAGAFSGSDLGGWVLGFGVSTPKS